jgi:hypothetical protein
MPNRGAAMTDNQDQGLSGLDEQKRQTLKRLGLGAAFVVPMVASFSLEGLTISKVQAAAPNGSGVHQCKPQPPGKSCDPDCGSEACQGGFVCVPMKGGGTRCDTSS